MRYIKMFLVPVFLFALCMNSFPQTADDIINKYIDAVGGMDKINSIQTAKVTGNFVIGSMSIPFTQTYKLPNSMLREATMQQMTSRTGFDGTTAWSVSPFMGNKDPQKMNEEQTKLIKQESYFFEPVVNYKDRGYTAELMGKEDMEGSDTYKLKLTTKDGDVSYYFIDAFSYLILKSTSKVKMMEKEVEVNTYYGDYKSDDGYMMAHAVEAKGEFGQMGNSQKVTVDKVEFNIPVDESIFKMPEVK